MTDISKLCMVCLSEKDENGICPRCKKATEVIQKANCLPLKTIIAGRYCIGLAVKKNGEGITYPAYDLKTNKKVSVREFYPETMAVRGADEVTVLPAAGSEVSFADCYNSFAALWQKIYRLKGLTSLITVNEVFRSNGTIYAVYAESELITLRDYLLQTKEGFIPWERARILFMPVLSTLGTLHTSGIIHRGINPSAFVFSKEGRLKLTDFCTENARTAYGDMSPELFDGYTPYEQYVNTGRTGPWSDIYSFCSVIYRALIGTTPIDAKTRALNDQMMIPARFAENLPPYVINALINGMQIKYEDRTSNIEQLRNDLSASPRAIVASAPVYANPVPDEAAQKQPQPQQPARAANPAVSPTRPINVPAAKSPAPDIVSDTVQAALAQENKEKNKNKNILIAVLAVVLALLLFAIGFLISRIAGMNKNNPDGESSSTTEAVNIMTIPDFRNMREEDVRKDPRFAGFFNFTTVTESSQTVENGRVIKQVPASGTAERGRTITLYVSSGPKSVKVPDVSGYASYDDAKAVLERMGFKCTKSSKLNLDPKLSGTVAETFPEAGKVVNEGETITIVLYSEVKEEPTTLKPEVTNDNSSSIEEIISRYDPQTNAPQADDDEEEDFEE